MKVTVKPLKGEPFTIDMEPEETVQALKAKVAAVRPELPAELQKLIFSGKVLMDTVTMQEGSIGDGDFVVIMSAKAPAAPAAPAPAPAAPEAAPAAPAPPPPAPPAADAFGAAASGMMTGEGLETSIQMLCDMGFPRDMVVRCLRAAFNNPDRAVDYLMNGIPPHLQQQASPPAPPANPLGPMAPVAPPAPGAGGAMPSMPAAPPAAPVTGPLAPLANHPRFAQLRQAVQQKPQNLHHILSLIGQADPNLITLVAEQQEEFVKLLAEAPAAAAVPNDPIAAMMAAAAQAAQAPGAAPAAPGAAAAPPAAPVPAPPPPAPPQPPAAPQLSPAEQEAIQRLEALGFPHARCVEAYLSCERNEELAASYLFDAMDET